LFVIPVWLCVPKYVQIMTIVSATDFRKNMSEYIQQTRDRRQPITITTQKQEAMVMLPLKQWESFQETLYLMSSPANKSRLDTAISDIRAGRFSTHNLDI